MPNGEKIKIIENLAQYGNYFNLFFSWSSYGSGNYTASYLLRLGSSAISNVVKLYAIRASTENLFAIENGNLYFYPNGDTTISGTGGAYIAILS